MLYKGRAAGIFTCVYSTMPIKLNRENLPEYPFSAIPFSIDFIDYEQTYKMSQNDETFNKAIEIVKSNGMINESILQKRLRIGQSKASLYITAMQKLCIISKLNLLWYYNWWFIYDCLKFEEFCGIIKKEVVMVYKNV